MVTSHADRTSPVVRGKWILENSSGCRCRRRRPEVPPLKENGRGREAADDARADGASIGPTRPVPTCHKVMDPIGFALENFDAVGAWRDREAGVPIDAIGAAG